MFTYFCLFDFTYSIYKKFVINRLVQMLFCIVFQQLNYNLLQYIDSFKKKEKFCIVICLEMKDKRKKINIKNIYKLTFIERIKKFKEKSPPTISY